MALAVFEEIARQQLASFTWLGEQPAEFNPADFYLAFNLVHRKIDEYPIAANAGLLDRLREIYPGFLIENWNSRDIARACLLLRVPKDNQEKVLHDLFTTADIGELEFLYQMLYFLPEPERFVLQAAEGIRTNMTRVFDAIALDNPYPSTYFSELQWNQMVLKAIFMERPLYRIYGLDDRANPELSRIARDFAHERWSAGRKVTPELWRLMRKFADGPVQEDLRHVLESEGTLEKTAALLIMEENKIPAGNVGNKVVSNWDELGKLIFSGNEIH